jgi:pyruvate formate lyase activating enzyme
MKILASRAPAAAPSRQPVPIPPGHGRIFDIKRFSTQDGPGIRTTVFFTGCPLRCAWCHNPEAYVWHDDPGDETRVRDLTLRQLIGEIERDVGFFDNSGGGVTLSGGEPLFQAAFTLELMRLCRARELHVALDTSGCVEPAMLLEAAGLADLVLYDIKAIDPEVHRDWTGAGNQRILENLHLLDRQGGEVWIRLPVVPGVNDDPAAVDGLIGLLAGTRFRRVSLLPFHRIGAGKYRRLGLPDRMAGTSAPAPEHLEAIRARFAAAGFQPQIAR